MTTIVTASGRRKVLPNGLETERVAGLDADGRIVVDDFGAREMPAGAKFITGEPYVFGLTLCCNASDKGMEDGVGCRGCHGLEGDLAVARDGRKVIADIGSYLYRAKDGSFPGLDPISHLEA